MENYNDWDSTMVKRTVCVVTKERVQIDFEGSWKLNYKPTERELKTADNLSFEGVDYRVDKFTAGSFEAEVTISTDSDITSFGVDDYSIGVNNLVRDILNSKIEITLKNGEKLKGLWYCGMNDGSWLKGSESGVSFTMKITYYKYNDYNNLIAWSNINSEDISSIRLGGTELLA